MDRTGNPVKRFDEITLSANEPGEDRHVIDVVSSTDLAGFQDESSEMTLWEKWAEIRRTKEQRGDGNEDLVFASVFDGCGGSAAVSELLQKTLHACLASALAVADRADPLAFTKAISDTFVLSFPFPLRLTRDDQLRSMGQGCSSRPFGFA